MIRLGIIGAGPNGSGNAKQLAQFTERCRITAVADPMREAAMRLAREYEARIFTDPADFLDEVDAVIISSPNVLHPDQTIAMANAGKHVFIEKPMALTVADADRMVAAVEKARVASMIGFSIRFEPVAQTMKSYYTTGKLGDLISIWSRRISMGDIPKDGWRSKYATSGGVISELIVHEIDYMVFIAGMPTTIYCRRMSRLHDDPRANDHIWLTLGFGNEATGTIEGSQMARMAEYYKGIIGTEGALHTRNWQSELYFGQHQSEANLVPMLPPFDKHAHFLDVIDGKCASVADVRWGRNIVLLSELALESAVTGQAIVLTQEMLR